MTMTSLKRTFPSAALLSALLVLVAAGCGDSSVPEAADESAGGYDAGVPMSVSGDGLAVADRQGSTPATPRPRMLIRTGMAVVEVEQLDESVDAVRILAERMGGFLANVALSGGRDVTRRASLTLRLPADRFDETLAALDSLGEVESVHVSTDDVGEAFADLEVRVANARRLEARLLDLLATRTGTLEDVLAVERELARVREEIERIDAQLRSMQDRVDMSTLTAELHEPEPLFSSGGGENVVLRAFRQAGRNFVGFVAGFIASLGVIVPLALLVGLVWWAWRALRRVRRRGAGFDR